MRFLLWLGLFYGIHSFPYAAAGGVSGAFNGYLAFYARATGVVLRSLGQDASVSGRAVTGRFSMEVAKGCDAIEAKCVLAAAVLAYPSSWRRRTLGLAAGLSFIALVNMARLVSLYLIGSNWPSAFEVFHLQIWQFVMILASVVAFVGWIFLLSAPKRAHGG